MFLFTLPYYLCQQIEKRWLSLRHCDVMSADVAKPAPIVLEDPSGKSYIKLFCFFKVEEFLIIYTTTALCTCKLTFFIIIIIIFVSCKINTLWIVLISYHFQNVANKELHLLNNCNLHCLYIDPDNKGLICIAKEI